MLNYAFKSLSQFVIIYCKIFFVLRKFLSCFLGQIPYALGIIVVALSDTSEDFSKACHLASTKRGLGHHSVATTESANLKKNSILIKENSKI